MKTRVLSILFALALIAGLLPVSARAADGEIAAKSTPGNGNPYYIMVNRKQSTVTIYGLDENGYYTVPVRAMICSAGAPGHATPKVDSSIGRKHRWHLMLGGVYAQYLSQFYGSCLFHSVCYSKPNAEALLLSHYSNLGQPASHGCVRLQTEDAKWIYDNCAEGTLVTIYDSDDPGELGKPARMVEPLSAKNFNGWDPTDPDPKNPWASQRTASISLSAPSICLTPGEETTLGVSRLPESTSYPVVTFLSDTPSVAVVDGRGRVRATGVGKATITVTCGDITRSCTVAVTEPGLPFYDVPSQAWCYQDIRYLYEQAVISGGDDFAYAPDMPLMRAEALQLLYNFAGCPEAEAGGADAPRAWYADAVGWAVASGLAEAGGEETAAISKGGLLELLFRYDASRSGRASRPDAPSAAEWALDTGLVLGDETGTLSFDTELTRAQAAALLRRYCEANPPAAAK